MFLHNTVTNYFFIVQELTQTYTTSNSIFYNSFLHDVYVTVSNHNQATQSEFNLDPYYLFYIDAVYSAVIANNIGYFLYKVESLTYIKFSFTVFFFFKFFFRFVITGYIVLTIFFITNFENYIKQILSVNILAKLFILNNTEKDVGPVDDYFLFAILFFLTIFTFIFSAIALFLIQSNIFTWAIGGFFLLTLLILTIPVSLFIDFGIVFCTAIRGSASGNNLVKELFFDIISTTTVFIRFVIQNIRFFFIFSGIFELLEWTVSNNSGFFLNSIYTSNNLFINPSLSASSFSVSSFNYLLLNSLLFVVLYLYYILHLVFLLLVQISVYLGISIWLFFFLYSTKFLTKFDKYFITKKVIN